MPIDEREAHKVGVKCTSGSIRGARDRFFIGKVIKPLKDKITIGDFIKNITASQALEGATEGVQTLWQSLLNT